MSFKFDILQMGFQQCNPHIRHSHQSSGASTVLKHAAIRFRGLGHKRGCRAAVHIHLNVVAAHKAGRGGGTLAGPNWMPLENELDQLKRQKQIIGLSLLKTLRSFPIFHFFWLTCRAWLRPVTTIMVWHWCYSIFICFVNKACSFLLMI